MPIEEYRSASPKKLLSAAETAIKIHNASSAENKSAGYPTPADPFAMQPLYLSGNIVKEGGKILRARGPGCLLLHSAP